MVSKQDTTITIAVTPNLVQAFTGLHIQGKGGFQRLMKEVAERVTSGAAVARFSPEEFTRVAKYATSYGNGGFQHKLQLLVAQWVAQHPELIQ